MKKAPTKFTAKCYAFPRRTAVACADCKASAVSEPYEFGTHGPYTFHTVELDGDRVTFRCDAQSKPRDRIKLLKKELPEAVADERKKVRANKKHGVAWAFAELADIGATEMRFKRMLEIVRRGAVRAATDCEVARWMNSHLEDRYNLDESLNERWSGHKVD